MKPRDVHIPLLLWVCSALVVHLCVSGGAEGVKEVEEKISNDHAEIREAVKDVRTRVARPTVMEVEIPPSDEPPPAPTPTDAQNDPKTADDDSVDKDTPKPADTPPPPKPEEAKKEPEKKPVEPPKPEEKEKPTPPEEKKKEEEVAKEKPLEVVPVTPSHKIDIKQAAANKIDNPNAPRDAKDANKVDEEKMARERSLDQDSAHPTSGANNQGPANEIGHSATEKSGQAEAHDGDPRRAPGEAAQVSTDASHEAPRPPTEPSDHASSPAGQGAAQPLAPQDASKGSVAGAGAASPDAVLAPGGAWSLDPANPGGDGRAIASGSASKHRDFVPNVRSPGLPIPGVLPGPLQAIGGFTSFEHAIGAEKLQKEREAVGAAIRAEHRGRLDTTKFERWKPAIENYDPSVKLGDETALNAAANPFAEYLHDIHNRLHPIFGDEFLGSGIASKEGLDDMTLVTHVELVLSKDEGKILRMGVTKRSGSTIFDAVALEALDRASPFGKAPDIIASPDGNVYLHWEFHRDPFDACSTRNAHPILLKHPPKLKPNMPLPPTRSKPHAEGAPSDDPPGPLLPLRKK